MLYLDFREKSITIIGLRSVFLNYSRVKYLDGTLFIYAVKVIFLINLTNPAYTEYLLSFRFAHIGFKKELF
jgi:hypothetical protein